jgi:hypothetical protein
VGLHDLRLSRSPSISLLVKQHHSLHCSITKTPSDLGSTRSPFVPNNPSPINETFSSQSSRISAAKRATNECYKTITAVKQQPYLYELANRFTRSSAPNSALHSTTVTEESLPQSRARGKHEYNTYCDGSRAHRVRLGGVEGGSRSDSSSPRNTGKQELGVPKPARKSLNW